MIIHASRDPLTLPGADLSAEDCLKVSVPLMGTPGAGLHGTSRHAFDKTTQNIRCLVAAGVHISVQTTVVSGSESVVDWALGFCREEGVRQLNILPFIPRGNGYDRRANFEATLEARKSLHELIRAQRKTLNGRLNIKWLDFNSGSVPVVEADGRFGSRARARPRIESSAGSRQHFPSSHQ